MILAVGESTPPPPPRRVWRRWLLGVTYMTLAASGTVAGCGLAGGGWDMHPFRLAAVCTLLVAPTLLVIRSDLSWLQRLGAAFLGLILALAAWLFTPAWPQGSSLYHAWTTREQLRQRWQQPALEDLKSVDYYARTLEKLHNEFPSLAAPLAEQWQRWIEAMLSLIRQRFDSINTEDVHAARIAYLQCAPLTKRLPSTRSGVEEAWQAWLNRAVAARIAELNRLSPDQWERLRSTASLRRQLAQYHSSARQDLIEAEQRWVNRSLDYHLERAEQHLAAQPRLTLQQCRQLKERLRHVQLLQNPQEPFLRSALQRVFAVAQRAAVQEVMQHIQAHRYLQAYSVARLHAIDWLPVVVTWDAQYRQRIESLRDTTRYLALLAERAPETLPPPRPAEDFDVAPPPRPDQK
jgi:hypothetical protein